MTSQEKLLNLADDLFEDLLATSDDELLTESSDAVGEAVGIRDEITDAFNQNAKARMLEARSQLNRTNVSSIRISGAREVEKRRFLEILASDNRASGLTMAARKGKSAQRDIASALSDFLDLHSCPACNQPNFGDRPKAQTILCDLGVSDPSEIDLEAIAWHLGVRIKREHLESCEARIIGMDDRAIVTVNSSSSIQRQRFSIGHELGHWIFHRGRMLFCEGNEIERPTPESKSVERAADRFSAELLMPEYLFLPIARDFGKPSFSGVRKLAEIFNTSIVATAIRLVELSSEPLVLTCHSSSGRRWFAKSKTISQQWTPAFDLHQSTPAFRLVLSSNSGSSHPRTTSAGEWFSRVDASRFEVVEESSRGDDADVLSLVRFKDAKAFVDFGPNK